MEKITYYKTSDGAVYQTEEEALEHEKKTPKFNVGDDVYVISTNAQIIKTEIISRIRNTYVDDGIDEFVYKSKRNDFYLREKDMFSTIDDVIEHLVKNVDVRYAHDKTVEFKKNKSSDVPTYDWFDESFHTAGD